MKCHGAIFFGFSTKVEQFMPSFSSFDRQFGFHSCPLSLSLSLSLQNPLFYPLTYSFFNFLSLSRCVFIFFSYHFFNSCSHSHPLSSAPSLFIQNCCFVLSRFLFLNIFKSLSNSILLCVHFPFSVYFPLLSFL